MEQFVAYIDETGGFSYLDKSQNCFVGGWVCRWEKDLKKKLKGLIQTQQEQYNSQHEHRLIFPNDMHFMPLHTPHYRKRSQDSHIKADPNDVPEFFSAVFQSLEPVTCMVFRSSGMPAIIPHEQAAYMEILRNTLVQLVNDNIFPDKASLNIIIARRRQDILYGYRGIEDADNYENYLARNLENEIHRASTQKPHLKVQIGFGKATKHPGLMIADFFCGALKKRDINYLSKYKEKIRIYRFSAGYRVMGAPAIQRLEYMEAVDPVAAIMEGAQIYTVKKDGALRNNLAGIFRGLVQNQKRRLFDLCRGHLDYLLRKSPDRYDNLDEAEAFLKLIKGFFPPDLKAMDPDTLRMLADLGFHAIRIASHRGRIDDGVVREHIGFLRDFSQKIFTNRMEYMQHLIDASLIAVQVQAFNPLKFDEAEENIRPIRDRYEEMFEKEFSKGDIIDENRARLEGTYGQICGFQYNLTGKEEYFKRAEESLKNDVSSCMEGSDVWEKGMGYLTSLYWRNGLLEKAKESFFKECQAPKDEKALFDLSITDVFGGLKKPFFLLHRLNICALAAREGQKIDGIDRFWQEFYGRDGLHVYPWCLSAKWFAVLLLEQNRVSDASTLLKKACGKRDTRDFTLDFVRFPLKLLQHLCQSRLNGDSSFSFEKEIDHLERLRPGTGQILKQLGLDQFRQRPVKDWDPYQVALLPPYYYA